MIVRVPGSSANLGPGFDALGMAVGRYAVLATCEAEAPEGARPADEHHPATIAHRRAGGSGPLWLRSDLPMGRGLGYSGAVRVAGAVAALCERDGTALTAEVRAEAVRITAALEGHPDNVAASAYGGVVVAAGGHVVPVPVVLDVRLVVWIPSFTTSTDSSRAQLPDAVPFDDAVFNVGRTGLLVAALAAGRTDVLRAATDDRLHQPRRFAGAERSEAAWRAALDAGALAAWLSGSGPTIAALVAPDDVAQVLAALPADGAGHELAIDSDGATVS